jgi:choice-of-anchor C domain-containing protein
MNKVLAIAAFAATLAAGAAIPLSAAQAVTVVNGSFEQGLANIGAYTTINSVDTTSITGWTVATGSVDYIGTYWQAADGSRSLDMSGNGPGSITQTINGLTGGQQYKVSFDLAGNTDGTPTTKTLSVTAGVGSTSYNFSTIGDSHGSMGWLAEFFYFTASGSSELLSFASATDTPFGPALDNVSISAADSVSVGATPVPPALVLFVGGLGVIGFFAMSSKRKAGSPIAA